MERERSDPRWLVPVVGASIGATALYFTGVFAFLFVVPIQIVATRRGAASGGAAAALGALLIVGGTAVRALGVDPTIVTTVLADALIPVALIAGVALLNWWRAVEWWVRLLAGSGGALLAAIPTLIVIVGGPDADGQLMMVLASMGLDDPMLAELLQQTVARTIGLGLTAAIAANWWVGRTLVLRSVGLVATLRMVTVPDTLVWALIAALALAVVGGFAAVEPLAVVGWNLLLVVAFLFAIQGVGLIQHLLHRRGAPARVERLALSFVLLGLIIPGVNLAVAVGLPLLGASEVWIDYRRGVPDEGNSER